VQTRQLMLDKVPSALRCQQEYVQKGGALALISPPCDRPVTGGIRGLSEGVRVESYWELGLYRIACSA